LISALHLYPDLFRALSWIRVNADEVISLVVWRRLVREDVPAHQVPDDEVLRAKGYNWIAASVFVAH
jgi:hypothetical protein